MERLLYMVVDRDDAFQQKARKLGMAACLCAGIVPLAHIVFTIYLLVSRENPSGAPVENKRLYGILVEGVLYCTLFVTGFALCRIYGGVSDIFASAYFMSVAVIWFGVAVTVPSYFVRENCVTIAVIAAFSCNTNKTLIIALCGATQLFSVINDSLYGGALVPISYVPTGYERMIYLFGGIVCGFCAVLGVHFQLVAHNHQLELSREELELMTNVLFCLTTFDEGAAAEKIELGRGRVRPDVHRVLAASRELYATFESYVSPAELNKIKRKITGDNEESDDGAASMDEVHSVHPMSGRSTPLLEIPGENVPSVVNMTKFICDSLSYGSRARARVVVSYIDITLESDDTLGDILQRISTRGGDTKTIVGDTLESTWNVVGTLNQPCLKSAETMLDIKQLCSHDATIYLTTGTADINPIKNLNNNRVYRTTRIPGPPRHPLARNRVIATEHFHNELDGKIQCFYYAAHDTKTGAVTTMLDDKKVPCGPTAERICCLIKRIESKDDEWMYQLVTEDSLLSTASMEAVAQNDATRWTALRTKTAF